MKRYVQYKSILIFILLCAVIIATYAATSGDAREDAFNTIMMILPIAGFVTGFVASINYSNKKMRPVLALTTLAILSLIVASFFWYLAFEGDIYGFTTNIADMLTLVGGVLFLIAILLYYRADEKTIYVPGVAVLVSAISCAYYAFFTYYMSFDPTSTLVVDSIYCAIMLTCAYLLSGYVKTTYMRKEAEYHSWMFLFFVILSIGSFVYSYRELSGTYYIGDMADVAISLAYAALAPAFLTYINKSESILRNVEEKYTPIFTHSGAPTFIINKKNEIILSNPRFKELLGLENTSRQVLVFHDIVEAKERSSVCVMLDEIRKRDISDAITKDIPIHNKKGDMLYCSTTLSHIPSSDMMVITLFDITERKKLEMELKKMNEDLQNFTFTVSHDLKEPLRNISSLATYLKRDYSENFDEMGMEFLSTLVTSVSTMSQLVDDLLTLSRVGRKNVDFSFVDLNSLIDEVLTDISKLVEEKHAVIRHGDLPKALVQKTWIKQVFQNLISNALKFNKSPAPEVDIQIVAHDFSYEFLVKDNGIGIEKAYHERIFKLFEQLQPREQYGGTGAGLAIVRKIIEEHKGEVWVESEVGIGTTFHFTIEKFFIGENE